MRRVTLYTLKQDEVLTTSDYLDVSNFNVGEVSQVLLGGEHCFVPTFEVERLDIKHIRKFDKVRGKEGSWVAVTKEVKDIICLEEREEVSRLKVCLSESHKAHQELVDIISKMSWFDRLYFLLQGWKFVICKIMHNNE